jgi:hypothetical protein
MVHNEMKIVELFHTMGRFSTFHYKNEIIHRFCDSVLYTLLKKSRWDAALKHSGGGKSSHPYRRIGKIRQQHFCVAEQRYTLLKGHSHEKFLRLSL